VVAISSWASSGRDLESISDSVLAQLVDGGGGYRGGMIRLHDTATQQVRELQLREPGTVSMYVCGPTVYGPPHLGHGRFSLVFDVLRRYLEWTGLEVRYVSNITDIDDKIINRANDEGRDWSDIAVKCESIWYRAMDALNVKRPTVDPHATAYVGQMTALIDGFLASDSAYRTSDGVYLDVVKVPGYGLLAHQSLDDMLAGGGERELVGAAEKRSPADFALWKFTKPGEPSWPASFGDGRPGWHTECVVMSLDLLGDGFDLHGGGMDLAFPHHENERAQAVACGRPFASHWVHNGFVVAADGEKMSKSLGNFSNLLDLIDAIDPRAYRMLVLQSHYRSPLVVDDDTLQSAAAALARIDSVARRVQWETAAPDPDTLTAFRLKMNDDLDTPGAMAVMFDAVRRANTLLDSGDRFDAAALVSALITMCDAVGLIVGSDDDIPDDAVTRAAALDAARAAKDFAEADRLRASLQADGYVVETFPDGTRLHRA
jgi:cysteinyl-tRNA synthetase